MMFPAVSVLVAVVAVLVVVDVYIESAKTGEVK
jgi:hypothetical protein